MGAGLAQEKGSRSEDHTVEWESCGQQENDHQDGRQLGWPDVRKQSACSPTAGCPASTNPGDSDSDSDSDSDFDSGVVVGSGYCSTACHAALGGRCYAAARNWPFLERIFT